MNYFVKLFATARDFFKDTFFFSGPYSNMSGLSPKFSPDQGRLRFNAEESARKEAAGPSQAKKSKYTAPEVKRYLRGLEAGSRARVVLDEASQFNFYVEQKVPHCLLGRERVFERLSSVLFQYTQGKPTTEIARTVSYLSDHEDVEVAMDYVSEVIARRINYRQVASRAF